MANPEKLVEYLDKVKAELGSEFIADADKHQINGRGLGAVIFDYACLSYMNGRSASQCAKTIKGKLS
jgi:hypothetical protein